MLLDLVAKPTFVYDFKRLSVGRSLIDSPAFRARRSSYPPGQQTNPSARNNLLRCRFAPMLSIAAFVLTHRQRSHRIPHATRISP